MIGQRNVLIYTTPTCPFCKKAKAFLTERGITYTEIDVAADEEKFDEMIEKSGTTAVPIFDIEGTIINGITDNEDRILEVVKTNDAATA